MSKVVHMCNVSWMSSSEKDEEIMRAISDLAAHYITDFLYHDPKIRHTTTTSIQLCDSIETATEYEAYGVCHIPVQMEMKKTNRLLIQVQITEDLHQMLHTLAHELTHAKQSYRGDLICGFLDPQSTIHIWKGKAFSTRVIGYDNWPWEVEANKVASEYMENWEELLQLSLS